MVSLNGDNRFKSSSVAAKLVLKGTGNFCLGAKSYRDLKVKQAINAILTVGLADRLIWLPAAWRSVTSCCMFNIYYLLET